MDSSLVDSDLVTAAEELLASLKSLKQPLTNANRAALLRQVDRLRCGLQGPAEAMAFQRTLVSSALLPLRLVNEFVTDREGS